MGISPKDQRIIYDVFHQLDASPTRLHGGVGLGLSIVEQLSIRMGAEITLESELSHGATFIVTLALDVKEEQHV